MNNDETIRETLSEIAGKVGGFAPEPSERVGEVREAVKRELRQVVSTLPESKRLTLVRDGIAEPESYCHPQPWWNLSLLPDGGGKAAMQGGEAWQRWTVNNCTCAKHVAQRVAENAGVS